LIIRIDRSKDRFLDDHVVGGVSILPTVMGLDLLVRATALTFTGHTQLVIRDVVVGSPVFVGTTPRVLRVTADAVSATGWRCRLTSAEVAETHLSATVHSAADSQSRQAGLSVLPIVPGITPDLIYPPFFHGPIFQVVSRFSRTDHGFLAFMTRVPPELRWSVARLQFRPRLLELFMQGCGLVALAASGRMIIPSSIERLTWYPDALISAAGVPERPAVAEVLPRRTTPVGAAADTFDGRVRDADGNLLLDVDGYRGVDLGVPADLKHAATLHHLLQRTEGVAR
jgi:hypothetical protein